MTNMGWESYDEKLDALLRGGAATWRLLEEIRADLNEVLRVRKPTKLALQLPTRTVKGKIMPNFELPNDEVVTITIETTNQAGTVEPYPAGDVFTVTSSSASLGVAIGTDKNGNPAIVLTPLVQAPPAIVVTVADSTGLSGTTLVVDIVPDVTDTNIVLESPVLSATVT